MRNRFEYSPEISAFASGCSGSDRRRRSRRCKEEPMLIFTASNADSVGTSRANHDPSRAEVSANLLWMNRLCMCEITASLSSSDRPGPTTTRCRQRKATARPFSVIAWVSARGNLIRAKKDKKAFHQDTQVSECLTSRNNIPWPERFKSLTLRFPITDSIYRYNKKVYLNINYCLRTSHVTRFRNCGTETRAKHKSMTKIPSNYD